MKSILNNWVTEKIVSLLYTHGFTSEGSPPETIGHTTKATVIDAFGNRYEIQVKHLSRQNTDYFDPNFNTLALKSKYSLL